MAQQENKDSEISSLKQDLLLDLSAYIQSNFNRLLTRNKISQISYILKEVENLSNHIESSNKNYYILLKNDYISQMDQIINN